MEEHALNQSAPSRTWEDTRKWLLNHIISWFLAFALPGGGTVLATWLFPSDVSIPRTAVYGFIGGLLGLVLLLVTTYVFHFILTPYRQRNETRQALDKLSQTPLTVECNSYEYSLIGKNWLQENEYIWRFNVILTNNSDKDNVGTKAVSLLVNYSTSDGKVKSYALSLVPETDRDKYGYPSMARGRPLVENEYLRSHEPRSGFYQFLDEDLTKFGIKSIQKWPTLVILDNFNAPHRREFPRSRFAIQSSHGKESSQPE